MPTRTQLQSELLETWEKEQKTCFFITHDVEEAIVLAQRVVIMYARPGRVKEVVDIDIPYPRTQETKMSPRFLELKNHIWRRSSTRSTSRSGSRGRRKAGASRSPSKSVWLYRGRTLERKRRTTSSSTHRERNLFMKKLDTAQMSRRSFLKICGFGAAAAGLVLVGCGGSGSTAATTEAASSAATVSYRYPVTLRVAFMPNLGSAATLLRRHRPGLLR